MTTTFTWLGAAGDDWFTKADWSPAGPPSASSAVVINGKPGPTLNSGDATLAHLSVTFAGAGANITSNGGTFGATFSLIDAAIGATALNVKTSAQFNGQFAFAAPDIGATLNINGTAGQALTIGKAGTLTASTGNTLVMRNGELTNNGTLDALGGVISVNSGTLDGAGTIAIGNGGTLYSNVDIGAGETITFLDPTGALELNTPAAFAGTITNFQPGDRIVLDGVSASGTSFDTETGILTVTAAGTVAATFTLVSNGSPLDFGTSLIEPVETIDSIITSSAATRTWNGGTADWYSAANWTSTPAAAPGFPVAGDTLLINSGTATVSPSDVLSFGTIDSEQIILNGVTGAPATLLLNGATIGANATIATGGRNQFGMIQVQGTTTLDGVIASQSQNGRMTINLSGGATLDNTPLGSLISSNFGAFSLTGSGTVINDGIIVAQGGLSIGSNVTIGNSSGNTGIIRLQEGGKTTIQGTVAASETVEFGDSTGTLRIANLPAFLGAISNVAEGDSIDLVNLAVASVHYNPSSDELSLFDNHGTQIGQPLTAFTIDGASGFSVQPDSNGGSLITYQPTVHVLEQSLPVPLVATPGTQVNLQTLLQQSFGDVPAEWTQFGLSYLSKKTMTAFDWSYWNTSKSQVTPWVVNGTIQPTLPLYPYLPPNSPTTTVAASSIDTIALNAGDNIAPATYLTIPVGGTPANPTSVLTYYIQPINPNVLSPTAATGIVNPSDIVASADRYAAFYTNVPNAYDCAVIADSLAAAAGAPMPYEDLSTDPDSNQEGGFWRIVYRGSDQASPVSDWSTLVQPGDVVRMAWLGGNDGQHTTTVVAKNPDGTLEVYDNVAPTISLHSAAYWTDTLPTSITIYRLDPNHQYMINGSSAAEFLQGSIYNNLIRPGGGADIITGGAGQNEIQDTATNLNGITVTDWHKGDTLDITDMPSSGATKSYNKNTGTLTVANASKTQQVQVDLPAGLNGGFQLFPDTGGNGTLVTFACFATGTRLRTPHGDVAVEALAVGDTLVTVGDRGRSEREIRWIGHRQIDLQRHRQPRDIQPIRIAPDAFGVEEPNRPLLLSPDHALFIDGVLIPVRHLIDGHKIVQIAPHSVTYWHVELDRHDVILAEGLPVESYLDTGQRSAFDGGPVIALHPDFCVRVQEAAGCAPLVVSGPILAAVRARLRTSAPRRTSRKGTSR